jgi:hypothetical protein
MSTVPKKRVTNKKRAEKPVSSSIHRAAARAGIGQTTIQADELRRLIGQLRHAAEEVVKGAPGVYGIPPIGGYGVHTVEALHRIYEVTGVLETAAELLDGGAS